MDKKIKIIIGAILLFGILLINSPYWDRLRIEGFSGMFLNILFVSDTKYAEGYTDKRFNKINIGMSEKEVITILGEPILRWSPYVNTIFKEKAHFIGLEYSISPTDTHYHLRQIYLDNGKVAEIIGYFYLD